MLHSILILLHASLCSVLQRRLAICVPPVMCHAFGNKKASKSLLIKKKSCTCVFKNTESCVQMARWTSRNRKRKKKIPAPQMNSSVHLLSSRSMQLGANIFRRTLSSLTLIVGRCSLDQPQELTWCCECISRLCRFDSWPFRASQRWRSPPF